jgi:hypothetical protein
MPREAAIASATRSCIRVESSTHAFRDRVPCAVVYAAAGSDHATAVEHAVEAL